MERGQKGVGQRIQGSRVNSWERDEVHPLVFRHGLWIVGPAAIHRYVVSPLGEPDAQLLSKGLEPPVIGGNATGSQNGDTHQCVKRPQKKTVHGHTARDGFLD